MYSLQRLASLQPRKASYCGDLVITHVEQPRDSDLCGAACVAMALGIPLQEAIERMGHQHPVRNWEVVKALGREGRFKRFPKAGLSALPKPCLLRVRWFKWHHLVLMTNEYIHDPSYATSVTLEGWLQVVERRKGRVVSYFPLNLES